MSSACLASNDTLCTVAALDTKHVAAARRFRSFQDFVAPHFSPDFRTDDRDAYSCNIRIGRIGDLNGFDVETANLTAEIKPARLRDIDERISIQLCRRGHIGIAQNGPLELAGPLDAILSCNFLPGSSTYAHGTRATTLFVQRDRVQAPLRNGFVIRGSSPALKLLHSWLGVECGVAAGSAGPLATLHSRVVTDLISCMLGSKGTEQERIETTSLKAARVNAILSTIDRQATAPDFSPHHLARQVGISSRYIRKLLEETGRTFSQQVREVRLQRAWQLLSDPSQRQSSISEIALTAGFSDISYFTRAFRHRFMMTPRDARVQSLRAARD